jgi:sRNA-binding protein
MSEQIRKEQLSGMKNAATHFEALREKWPKAFPKKAHEVRPLATGASKMIADVMGWTYHYARGVLHVWKGRDPYCHAVLRHKKRITLEGVETAEEVDERALVLARKVIERRKSRREKDAAKRQQRTEPATEISSSSEAA